jgi:hypothetical protein
VKLLHTSGPGQLLRCTVLKVLLLMQPLTDCSGVVAIHRCPSRC